MPLQFLLRQEINDQATHVRVCKDMIMFFLRNGTYIFNMNDVKETPKQWLNKKLVTCSTEFNQDIILGHPDGSLTKIIRSSDGPKFVEIKYNPSEQSAFIHLFFHNNSLVGFTYLGLILIFDQDFQLVETINTYVQFTSAISTNTCIYLTIKTKKNDYYLRYLKKDDIQKDFDLYEQDYMLIESIEGDMALEGEPLEIDINSKEDHLVLATDKGQIYLYELKNLKIELSRIFESEEKQPKKNFLKPVFVQFYRDELLLFQFNHKQIQVYNFKQQSPKFEVLFRQNPLPSMSYVAIRQEYLIIVYKDKEINGNPKGKIKIFDRLQIQFPLLQNV